MKIKPEYFRTEYSVMGTGRFPYDMLRYDKACPASESDTLTMSHEGPREVRLYRFTREPATLPARARWRSYGWDLLAVIFPDGKKVHFNTEEKKGA